MFRGVSCFWTATRNCPLAKEKQETPSPIRPCAHQNPVLLSVQLIVIQEVNIMGYAVRRYPRIARMEQIAHVLHRTCVREGLTTHQIAFWMQMKPSGHLRGLLQEMERAGWVSSEQKHHRPGIEKSVYNITLNGMRFIGKSPQLELEF